MPYEFLSVKAIHTHFAADYLPSNKHLRMMKNEKRESTWKNDTQDSSIIKLIENEHDYDFLQILANNSQMLISIFNLKTFKFDFISDNVQALLGVSLTEYHNGNYSLFSDKIGSEHTDYSDIISKIIEGKLLQFNSSEVKITIITCGLKYNHPTKGVIRLFIKHYIHQLDENRKPLNIIITIHDFSYFLKFDFYWIYVDSEANSTKMSYYSSKINEILSSKFMSSREKEILILISQGFDTNAIASKLYLSPFTVNNHRQNILNRLGAKDTTALLHITKLSGLI